MHFYSRSELSDKTWILQQKSLKTDRRVTMLFIASARVVKGGSEIIKCPDTSVWYPPTAFEHPLCVFECTGFYTVQSSVQYTDMR